jgi:hypothetical protein
LFTLRQYLITLADSHGLTRTLGEIEVCRDEQGHMSYTVGNSAAVFRIRHRGRIRSLRCYMHTPRRLREIYAEKFLPQELFLYTSPSDGVWVDAVLGEWIDGITLYQAVCDAAPAEDSQQLQRLAAAFDRLAASLVADNWAHGDLKPENIIVDESGELHLIDFDAMYLPAFAAEQSQELGTKAYQHPARTTADFDASLDDYPAALISTALHALALDPTLYIRYPDADGLLFTPQYIHTDPALEEALALFERQGLATQYRIARLLTAPTHRLSGLADLLTYAAEQHTATSHSAVPELFVQDGLWGYRTRERIIIPPLYDCGFDFTEKLAAVQLGKTWHFIDPAGCIRLSCPECEAVKPFRGERAQVIRNGRRLEIDRTGREFEV